MVHPRRVVAIWLAVQLVSFSAAAHAYLDPGTGSMLVQSLLAGVAGAVAVIGLYWQRVKAFFANMRKSSRASSTDNEQS
jgi:nitrate/nitrite transporter NarK